MKPLLHQERSPLVWTDIWYIPNDKDIGPLTKGNSHMFDWHREDGPAFINTDAKTGEVFKWVWWYKGLRHRFDGKPASYAYMGGQNGKQYQWLIRGADITHEFLNWYPTCGIEDHMNLTPEEVTLFQIKFGKYNERI